MIFSMGLRPLNQPQRAFEIVHCDRCFKPIVYAWDDMFPTDEADIFKRSVDLEELPPERGHVVLWFQVDEHGTPIGRQMFQRWEPRSGYAGPTWRLHLSTCNPRAHLRAEAYLPKPERGGQRHGNR